MSIGIFAPLEELLVSQLRPFVQLELLDNQTEPWPADLCGFITNTDKPLNYDLVRPIESSQDLMNIEARQHFLVRVLILHELNQLNNSHLTRGALILFHSCYKLLLLAHCQPDYRKIGPFVAQIDKLPLASFFIEYRLRLMALLQHPATRDNHTNVLSHIQGYFRSQLNSTKRHELAQLIQAYRNSEVTLSVPIELIKHYMFQYPNEYLDNQRYFDFYPTILVTENN